MSERTLILSATNVLARGFLVVPTDRRSRDGAPVNGLFAVASAVLQALSWKAPSRAIAVIDRKSRDWPELLVPQLERLPQLLEVLGFRVVETADEQHVVATYCRAALQRGDDVVIVGADKRYAQLVSDRVWWYDSNKDARYTPEIVRKRFGVGPDRVADWLALVGDDDQVPGIKGIGAKGATGLLEAHATIEDALKGELEGRLRKALDAASAELPEHLARARLSDRPLPVELEDATYSGFDSARLNAEFEALGFVELLLSTAEATKVTVCRTVEEVAAALKTLGSGQLSFFPLIEDADEAVQGVAVSAGEGAAFYVETESPGFSALTAWLKDERAPKSGHDLVGARVAFSREGIELRGITYDSACASHLTQPSGWAPHELWLVARQALGRSLQTDDEVLGTGTHRKSWSDLTVEVASRIAAERADASAAISKRLETGVEPRLMEEYLAISDVLVRMELLGVAVDVQQLDRAEASFERIEQELSAEIEKLAGHSFNINSSAQLGKVLFEELKLPVVSHTKTGYSTSNDALERVEHAHPIVSRVLRWRLVRRLGDSWVRPLRRSIHADGRVHSRFYPARSFDGQIISTNPDLSRVPGRTPEMAEIRRAFVAKPGRLLMSVDFSQLGLYVLAHLTKDPALVDPLRDRADMHRLTAAAVLEKKPEDITTDERQLGKVINFATFAGQGASALALQLGVSAAEAKEYLARFDRRYAKVREFQDEQLRLAKERGYITTLAGRHWPIGGLESLDSQLRSYAERMARRGTHEGSVADVSRRALLDADRAIQKAGLSAFPIVEVVDEVLFEVGESELEQSARVCSEAMRNAFKLEVPLVTGVWVGKNWADLEPFLTADRKDA
ncbi:MAG: DNA polymerase [Myxococcaceae bacterium]